LKWGVWGKKGVSAPYTSDYITREVLFGSEKGYTLGNCFNLDDLGNREIKVTGKEEGGGFLTCK